MSLTVVMYHYVRNLKRSRYPRIKGRELCDFKGQLRYLVQNYQIITVEQLLSGEPLPRNAALLTFDDGFSDHYLNVFPLLEEAGIQGLFFPPAMPIIEEKVLDVHKIHFILAAAEDMKPILEHIRVAVGPEFATYYVEHAQPSRFDPAPIIFIKRMLQVLLPEEQRASIVHSLFQEFVTADENAFATELYMSPEQLKCMHRNGMYIGSHGYRHLWMGKLPAEDQTLEIDHSLDFLRSLGVDTSRWIMSYPYGNSNDSLISTLKSRGCTAAFTTEVRVAEARDCLFHLPRLDTNDLPVSGDQPSKIAIAV
jgi:peptidoglycan/xylan/chitin deacetylase (PgdA/CDA1 family)